MEMGKATELMRTRKVGGGSNRWRRKPFDGNPKVGETSAFISEDYQSVTLHVASIHVDIPTT
jgi:hypothetical protein